MSLTTLKRLIANPKRQQLGLVIVFIVILIAGFAISYTLARQDKTATSGNVEQSGRLADKDGKAVYEVQLNKDNNDPIDLLIKIGEYVQFNSKDGGEHQVIQGMSTNSEHGPTFHTRSPLDSGLIKADEGYLLQFNKTGKYDFHDNYDHDYTITVIVYDPNGPKRIEN